MRRALAGTIVAVVALLCLAPSLFLWLDPTHGPESLVTDAWRALLAEPRQRALLLRSLGVAGGAAALALLWGLGVGYAAWRLSGWKGALVETLSYVPLLLPSLVLALGWVFLIGPAGIVTGAVRALTGQEALPFDLYTPGGAAFVLSLTTFPCVSILVAQGLRSLDPDALHAARLCAGPWRVGWRVVRPELAPSLATGALLAFLLAFADFGVPSALMVNVYPIETFTRFSALQDPHGAVSSTLPPLALALGLFLLRLRLVRPLPAARSLRRAGAAAPAPGPALDALGLGLGALALLLALVLPLGFLLATARGDYAAALRIAGEQLLTSLEVALGAMLLLVVLGSAFALAHRQLGARGRALAELAVLVTLLLPGAAVGLGLVGLAARGIWPFAALEGSGALLACASAARFVAFPSLVLALGLQALPQALFSAASVHGVGPRALATRLAAPLLAPVLASAAALSFVASLGELSAAVLVAPPGTMTLPVRLASLLHFGKDSLVAALCVMLVGLVLTVLLLGTLLARRPLGLRLPDAHRAP